MTVPIPLPSIGTLGPVSITPAGEVHVAGQGARDMDIFLSRRKAVELHAALGAVLYPKDTENDEENP
jgi:hypothetical protein